MSTPTDKLDPEFFGHDMFVKMMREQFALQRDSYGLVPHELDEEDRASFITWNAYALEDEIHEATSEVGWKPWATSRHLNRGAYLTEMVDAFHFFMNLLLVAGIGPREFFDAYMAKRNINALRQATGYDGVSGKCGQCHRELADDGSCPIHGIHTQPLITDER
jgi:hypothetical protein